MTDTPSTVTPVSPKLAPSGAPKALVLITRTTICDCGERFATPELYERFQPLGHWALRSTVHLRRLHSMPQWRLRIERQSVLDQIPFCDTCLALGNPLGELPQLPDSKTPLVNLDPAAASQGVLAPIPPYKPAVTKPPAAKPAARRAPLSLDDIFGTTTQ